MAEIYLKSAENTLILEPRESVNRPFNFGTWTELRLGMYLDLVSSVGNDSNPSLESVTISTPADYMTIGLKDAGTAIPGAAGSIFLGAVSPTDRAATIIADQGGGNYGIYGTSSTLPAACGSYDTNFVLGTSASTLAQVGFPSSVAGVTTAYDGFYALKFVIANQGLASQTVTISVSQTNAVAGSNYGISALRTAISNATYGSARTVTWNTGAAARAIPTCWYMRLPFNSNRARISSVCLMKIS